MSDFEIRKARRITGKSLVFRDACVDDAEFILSLRTDERKSRHLSSTSPELSRQIEWLNNYAGQGGQAYFVIETLGGERLGTVRLYDAQGDSFCWGSWIIKDGAPGNAAIESALMVYAYAIEHLGFEQAHFEVRKGNESVWRFHERFGAVRFGETDEDYLYRLDKESILSSRKKYQKFLSDVTVEY